MCVAGWLQVRLYRNGDAHFAGMNYPVSAERHRTLDSLLEALTNSVVCDRAVLPLGVRYLFAVDSERRVSSLDQLVDGASYVCCSRPQLRRLHYDRLGAVKASRSHHHVSIYTQYVLLTIAQIPLGSSRHARHDSTRRDERVEPCCSTSSTQAKFLGSTRRTCRVVS